MPVNTQSYPGLTGLTRRQCLLAAAGLAGWTAPSLAFSASGTGTTLAAAWEADNRYQIGLIAVNEQGFSIQHATPVPTRPHALLVEAGGSLLAVARRPGDWLVRWRPGQPEQKPQWHWIDGDRRFNGHAVPSADGGMLWTTETDLETAEGRLGVRNPASLEKIDEWTTHGMDPHELLVLPQRVGAFPAGTLVVANGGIATLPETGRTKRDTARMDASLVALHPRTGARLGQWRLADPYLSVRHLAWDARNQRLGIALQAEHPSPDDRWRAPVLAIWDGECLAASPKAPDLRGRLARGRLSRGLSARQRGRRLRWPGKVVPQPEFGRSLRRGGRALTVVGRRQHRRVTRQQPIPQFSQPGGREDHSPLGQPLASLALRLRPAVPLIAKGRSLQGPPPPVRSAGTLPPFAGNAPRLPARGGRARSNPSGR
jgi:uncharacterized protein